MMAEVVPDGASNARAILARRRSRRRATSAGVATLVVVAILALGACGGTKEEPAAGAAPGSADRADQIEASADVTLEDGGSLVMGVPDETAGWNVHVNQVAGSGMLIASSILEPLATRDADGHVEPYLAESIEPNDDFTEWTITTRDGITFHDGTPFDAEAVKANMDDGLASIQVNLVYGHLFPKEGAFTVVDPRTVKVQLTEPWAVFDQGYLAAQQGFMMSPKSLASEDKGSTEPVGTGPYAFSDWVPGDHLGVVKNPHYWKDGEPHLDEITFRVIPDPLTMINALRSGDIDMYYGRTADSILDLDPEWQLVKDWDIEPAYIQTNALPEINGEPNPIANVHARKALAYATDRAALAETFGGGATPPTSPFSPDSPWGAPVDQNGYVDLDVDKAKEEVQAYKDDTGESTLTVTLSGGAADARLLQTLQSQWAEAGIETKLENLESTALINQAVVGKMQLGVFGYYAYLDPDQCWHFWSSATAKPEGELSINFNHFSSPTIDANIATGRTTSDEAKRKAAYLDVVKELNENAVHIWTYWVPNTIVATTRVGGLQSLQDVTWANSDPKTFWGQIGLVEGA